MPRILLIEDSPTQARRMTLILEEAGFAVESAGDARSGLERLAEGPFDLVLSDLLLPGDSGFDLCRQIKADVRWRHIPVVVLTSQADPANVLRGLEAGADGFLTKDREPEDIVRCLRRILATAGPPPGAASHVVFLDQEYEVAATREQLLNVLGSAFEDVVRLNQRVQADAAALRELNLRLQQANGALEERNQRLQELADELAATALSERQAHEQLKKTQSQLVQSEKLASLGQLAAGMAHEINNPLSYSINNLAILRRDALAALEVLARYRQGRDILAREQPELAADLAHLEEQADLAYLESNLPRLLDMTSEGLRRVRDIVKNLRDFARLDEGELKEIDLRQALTSTLEILHSEMAKKQIRLDTFFQEIPPILCHPGKINQVLLNVLLNAVQACGTGGTVTVRNGIDGDHAVWVEIEDDGCGIRPEHLPHIFDPFFTTKPVGQGMGLGLSISYGIIKEHGGSISVDSTPGRGSVFRIRLPLRRK